MMKSGRVLRIGISGLLAMMFSLAAVGQETDQSLRAIESTRTLIEKSTSAQQIDQSKVPESIAKRDEARALLKQAEEAHKKGAAAADVTKYLNDARKTMFAAVRLANPEQVRGEKQARDYETRLASVKVLRDALQRLGGAKNEAAVKEADGFLAEGQQHAAQSKFDLARASVEKAYAVIKASNIEQRDHTEAVASKNFATKEDEFKYEIGRNNEYEQLSAAVLSNMAAGMVTMYKPVAEKASGIRKAADEQAAKSEFEVAVKTIESSTAEYKKIIRAGGIPVP